MRSGLRMYMLLIRASLRSRMQYKFNFIFSSLMAALVNAAEFLMVALVLDRFGSVKGWSLYEVAYLYAVIMLSKAIYRSLASDVHHLEKYLVSGDMDALLIRPLPVLFVLMTQNFRLLVGEFGQGLLILAYAMTHLMREGQIGWQAVPLTVVAIGSGALILFAIGLATASAGFWLTRIEELQNVTEDAARSAAQYPLDVYPGWLRYILLTFLPVGLANYVPASVIIRHEYGTWALAAVAVMAFVFVLLAGRLWKLGISRYQSTGT